MMVGRLRSTVLPAVWVTMSAIWAVIILVTDRPAWPLALWIATTVGPLTAIERWHRAPRLSTAGRRSRRPRVQDTVDRRADGLPDLDHPITRQKEGIAP